MMAVARLRNRCIAPARRSAGPYGVPRSRCFTLDKGGSMNRTYLKFLISLLALAVAHLVTVVPAHAQRQAVDFTSAPTTRETPINLGYSFFTNSSDVLVSALGYFDDGGDGFLESHE